MQKLIWPCLISILFLAGCSHRDEGSKATIVRFAAPKSLPSSIASKVDVPSSYKVCYAVNITGPELPTTTRSCGADLGVFSGYVAAGETMALTVKRGKDRKVTIYSYMTTDPSATCPTLGSSCDAAVACNTYKLDSKSVDIESDSTDVTLSANFPGLTANAVSVEAPSSTLCKATIAAALTTSGQIVEGSSFFNTASANSAASTFTFYRRSSTSTFEAVSRSSVSTESSSMKVKPVIRSMVVRPGSSNLYGVLYDGTLVAVDSTGDYSTFTSSSCPFATCQLPVWFRSFSIGHNSTLFGLDYGGGVWRVDSTNSLALVQTIPAYIQQVYFQ